MAKNAIYKIPLNRRRSIMEKTGIGIVGVGAISGIYLQNLTNTFKEVYVTGICDLIPERSEKAKEDYKD